jgi:hypothetical protein
MRIDYDKEPRRAIFFEDVKSNYASIECVQRKLHPLTTSSCVMSRSYNSYNVSNVKWEWLGYSNSQILPRDYERRDEIMQNRLYTKHFSDSK